MFRIRDSQGAAVECVEVVGVFDGHATIRRRKRTADGLCIVHWPAGARHLDAQFRFEGMIGRATVQSDRPDPHRVIDIRLSPAST